MSNQKPPMGVTAAHYRALLDRIPEKKESSGPSRGLVDSRGIPYKSGDDTHRDAVVHDTKDSHKKNFDQKIYMFPESYNALRTELMAHWPSLWALVSWRMAYRAEEFVEQMNDALGMAIIFDTEKVAWICEEYYKKLRSLRRLSS